MLWVLLSTQAFAQVTDTLTFVHYNIMRYAENGCLSLTTKNARLRTIFNYLQPDILTVNEMTSNAASVSSLRINALVYNAAMQQTTYGNSVNSPIVNMLYYNADKLGYLGHQVITGNTRDVDIYRLYSLVGTSPGDTLDFYCIVTHFKASTGFSNEQARTATAQSIVNWMDQHPEAERVLLSGDLNLYSINEQAYQTLLSRLTDLDYLPSGWEGAAYAQHHTQSPAESDLPCSITGGLDDRFDFIFASNAVASGNDLLRYAPGSYQAVANDGSSYNTILNCITNTSVPFGVCDALRNVSDHLPVLARLVVSPLSAVRETGANAFFRVLGNPSTGGIIRLKWQNEAPLSARWRLHSADGRAQWEGATPDSSGDLTEIAVGQQAPGLYFLAVMTEGGRWVGTPVILQ
jgi:endonuclease/exonuclease/phosphatase family metal-dependent hydrolase